MESDYCHSIYIRRKLLLLAGSRWNIFHVEPDCSMPINNLADTSRSEQVDQIINGEIIVEHIRYG